MQCLSAQHNQVRCEKSKCQLQLANFQHHGVPERIIQLKNVEITCILFLLIAAFFERASDNEEESVLNWLLTSFNFPNSLLIKDSKLVFNEGYACSTKDLFK